MVISDVSGCYCYVRGSRSNAAKAAVMQIGYDAVSDTQERKMSAIDSLRDWIALIDDCDFNALDDKGIALITGFIAHIRPYVATFVHRVPIQDVWRLTPNRAVLDSWHDRRVSQLSLLKYPPAEKAGYGRANLPGRSVFYGSFSRLSPKLETKPVAGDLVTLTRWQSGPAQSLAVAPMVFLPEIVAAMPSYQAHHHRYEAWLSEKSAEDAQYVREATEFMTRQFIKPIPRGQSPHYLVSATFVDMLLQDERIDAVIYPSVATALHDVNIAIKPAVLDRLFTPVEAEELMIARVSADGSSYHQHRTARAHEFDMTTDAIRWDDALSVPEADLPTLRDQLEQT